MELQLKKIEEHCLDESINCIEITSANFDKVAINLIKNRLKTSVFRGVSTSATILPGIIRYAYRKLQRDFTISELKDEEINLLFNYNKFSVQFLPYYENCLDVIASAQHYGLPTRLMDWTEDPFVAVYFAINNIQEGQNGYLMERDVKLIKRNEIIDTANMVKDSTFIRFQGNNRINNMQEFFNIMDGQSFHSIDILNLYGLHTDSINSLTNSIHTNKFFLKTNIFANPRISLQKGLFQVYSFQKYYNAESPNHVEIDCIVKEQLKECKIFKINYNEKKAVLEKLEKLGINQFTLFNDLENICRYLQKV